MDREAPGMMDLGVDAEGLRTYIYRDSSHLRESKSNPGLKIFALAITYLGSMSPTHARSRLISQAIPLTGRPTLSLNSNHFSLAPPLSPFQIIDHRHSLSSSEQKAIYGHTLTWLRGHPPTKSPFMASWTIWPHNFA